MNKIGLFVTVAPPVKYGEKIEHQGDDVKPKEANSSVKNLTEL